MMSRHQFILIVLVAGLFAGWTPTQKAMWGTYTLAWAVDLGQTRYIAKNPDIYYEDSASYGIGEHPSTGRVHNFFAIHYIKNYIIADVIGDKWRNNYLGVIIIEHLYFIQGNKAIGIKIDYKF